MSPTVLSLAAIVLYLLAAAVLALDAKAGGAARPTLSGMQIIITAAAVLIHGIVLYQAMLTPQGLDVSVFNTASLVGWMVAMFALIANLARPLHMLLVGLLPLAALSLALEWLFGRGHAVTGKEPGGVDLHIALSLVSYSLLMIAAFQAVLIAIADRQLRRKRPIKIMRMLPPLATMEVLLFQLLTIGFFLLTLGQISGFMFVHDLFAQHLVHKTVLSMLAWVVFAVLLWGRYLRGWRGRTAVRYTLAGFLLLAVGFFGSQVVLQLILKRV